MFNEIKHGKRRDGGCGEQRGKQNRVLMSSFCFVFYFWVVFCFVLFFAYDALRDHLGYCYTYNTTLTLLVGLSFYLFVF